MSKKISNHILEIRFQANPRFLDKKGNIAAQIISDSEFDHWNISNNRIDFNCLENPNLAAFFSFKNIGATSNSPVTSEAFLKATDVYIKAAWQYLEKSAFVRIGLRSQTLIEVDDFTQIYNAYKSRFLKLNDADLSQFDGDLIDVGFALNFVSGENHFNTSTGPMEKKQSETIFGASAYDVGIYLEVDYFRNEISPNITQKQVIGFVNEGVSKADKLSEQINKFINLK